MIHLDLFSGIGGFALAVDYVFPELEHIFCEIDPYCQALLKRRFPGATIFGDIRELTADTYRDRLQEQRSEQQAGGDRQLLEVVADTEGGKSWQQKARDGREDIGRGSEDCFILTGGFPCQPFSQAGKRRGTEDNRYLWPEMLRVIREFRPSWVIAENVRGLLTIEQGVVFQQVCVDLEGEGYETQPFIIPAVAVNAPHRRDRVWFVANRNDTRSRTQGYGNNGNWQESNEGRQGQPQYRIDGQGGFASDTKSGESGEQTEREGWEDFSCRSWETNWLEVATELCGVDDGLPAELDTTTLSKSRHRVERLKALGNSIVPQVAIEILQGIKYAEGGKG